MTAEEREFYLEWFAEMRRKENEAKQSANTRSPSEPQFGPAAT